MSIADAGMNGVQYLYHYQAFHTDRLNDLLTANRIYLSDTKGFNDPWDCRPCFDWKRLDDGAFYNRQVEFLALADKKHNPLRPAPEHEQRVERLRRDRTFLERCITQASGIDVEIQKRYRVYCLTTKPADVLMWSHYGDKHTGVCLEFRCDNGTLNSALKINYFDTYPSLDLADDNPFTALLPVLCKAREWEYEDEYRLIAQEESAALNRKSLLTKNNYLQLPDNSLSGVIVGCLSPPSTLSAIRALISASGRGVDMKEAKRVPDRYTLTIGAVAP